MCDICERGPWYSTYTGPQDLIGIFEESKELHSKDVLDVFEMCTVQDFCINYYRPRSYEDWVKGRNNRVLFLYRVTK